MSLIPPLILYHPICCDRTQRRTHQDGTNRIRREEKNLWKVLLNFVAVLRAVEFSFHLSFHPFAGCWESQQRARLDKVVNGLCVVGEKWAENDFLFPTWQAWIRHSTAAAHISSTFFLQCGSVYLGWRSVEEKKEREKDWHSQKNYHHQQLQARLCVSLLANKFLVWPKIFVYL